ncbi:hypothetical protein J6590_068725 [Homalodisca vitripennis]|nr:hypothetical protein J6590_068725 [Homalodisca vitripennis]
MKLCTASGVTDSPEEGEASFEPASPVKAGRGWHTLVHGSKNLRLLGNKPHQLQQISTFAVSDVPLLDIHKVAQIKVTHRFLLCPVVGSPGRYKPVRSDPCRVTFVLGLVT